MLCVPSTPWPMPCAATQSSIAHHLALQVKFGVNGLATPGETYALTFAPAQPLAPKIQLFPDPSRPGCYLYRVRTGEMAQVIGV